MAVRRCWALILLGTLPTQVLAAFDETDVIQFNASASMFHDDNLYRLPDVDPRLFGISPDNKSDIGRTLGAGIKVDKLLSRQRLIADFNVYDTSYDRNSNLDHVGHTGRASWLWRIGNQWDGELGYRQRKYLAGFADSRLTFKDMIETKNYLANGGYQFHPRWRVEGELNARESRHSASTRKTSDFDNTGGAVSLRYRTPASNMIGAELRRNEGEYPNREVFGPTALDSNYVDREVNTLVHWRASGALTFDATLGYTERRHDTVSSRDFSGATGHIAAIWEPTGKIRVTVTGRRDIRGLEDAEANFVLLNSIVVTPVWALTSKVVLQGNFKYETRDYLGDPIPALTSIQAREDTLRSAKLGIIYSPLRYLDLSLSYERGDRRSNFPLNDFDYQTWFGVVQLRF